MAWDQGYWGDTIMKILSHRGFWKTAAEQNSRSAFEQAVKSGFGIETDIRDCIGKLVISHDMPSGNEMDIEDFLSLSGVQNIPLALNIKSDGLYNELKRLLKQYDISDYFVFDMSVPDTIGYIGMNFASRVSEYEKELPFYGYSSHVWLDCFNSDWFSADEVEEHISQGKKVCVVSPELHKRDYRAMWQMLKNICSEDVMICTDMPNLAKDFFE